MARGRLCARLGRPLGLSSSQGSFCLCLLFATTFLAFSCNISRCQDAHCISAINGSQFSQTLGYRPSTFARCKNWMFCEPMRFLLWTRLSITARSVPSSPTDTLLIEASVFLEKDVFVMLL